MEDNFLGEYKEWIDPNKYEVVEGLRHIYKVTRPDSTQYYAYADETGELNGEYETEKIANDMLHAYFDWLE